MIITLQSYLTSSDIDCLSTCSTNFYCQQALSLLTQLYDYCPLGTIKQSIIMQYQMNTNCSDCLQTPYYNNNNNPCIHLNCTNINFEFDLTESIFYVVHNCSGVTDCTSTNTNTSDCQSHWDILSSFQRLCRFEYDIAIDWDDLYNSYNNNNNACDTDCDIEDNGYTMDNVNCKSNDNIEFEKNYKTFGKLDIDELKKAFMLCFYGLDIHSPTDYVLVCIDNPKLNTSGINSFEQIPISETQDFWNEFAFAQDMDFLWVLICGALIFFMQLGFTMLEAGMVRNINVMNILFKNIMDTCLGAIVFYIIGYCVAFGDPTSPHANGFMGVEDILIESEEWTNWFFQWAFAANAATIVSGALAERCQLEAYFIYTLVITTWIYPIVVHWVWDQKGWISTTNTNPAVYAGAIDFAGSAVVHMVGGWCGLIGTIFLGPRLYRFDKSDRVTSKKNYKELMTQFEFGHNVPFQVLGTLILWFGWYGFNCGSTLSANNGAMEIASKVAVNTTISGAMGGIVCCIIAKFYEKAWHVPRVCNGILCALVAITASGAVCQPWGALIIGLIAGIVYFMSSVLLVYLEIDDPLDAWAVHGMGGVWGVLAAGIFGTESTIKFAGYPEALYADTTHGERFATQLTLVVTVAAWVVANSVFLFAFLWIFDILRVPDWMERQGLDQSKHGGSAMNIGDDYQVEEDRVAASPVHRLKRVLTMGRYK